MSDLLHPVRPAPVLWINPPFGPLDRACLGLHLLQATLSSHQWDSSVYYANLHFAGRVGEATYQQIARAPISFMVGERLFARAAFGTPPLGRDHGQHVLDEAQLIRTNLERAGLDGSRVRLDIPWLLRLEEQAFQWVEQIAEVIAQRDIQVVAATSMFEQSAAAIALLTRVKARRPEVITLLGGANCDGPMAHGIAAAGPAIDHIFSGECDEVIVDFFQAFPSNRDRFPRVIQGRPLTRLDATPTPRQREHREQVEAWLGTSDLARPGGTFISYETSRGCWWGEKSHCTFCGLNGTGMGFRAKSPDRVLSDLRALLADTPGTPVAMTDNIMPHSYFRTLMPRLPQELPEAVLFYEEKANVTLERMGLLAQAKVREIQFGIESLSTDLLKLMGKGVKGSTNLTTLRYAAAWGIVVQWNMLFGFPGDKAEYYREILALIPKIRHLPPPSAATPVLISRFSPYFEQPERFQIKNLRPLAAYGDIYPESVSPETLAYHFAGDFPSASQEDSEIFYRLVREVILWRRAWNLGPQQRPQLTVHRDFEEFLLLDSRGLPGTPSIATLSGRQAAQILVTAPLSQVQEQVQWALDAQLGVALDGQFVPLAVASPEVLAEFEKLGTPQTRTTA